MKLKKYLVKFNYIKDMHYMRIPNYKNHIDYYKNLKIPNLSYFGGSLFPYDGSYLFLEGENDQIIKDIIDNDPFYKSNLVLSYQINEFEQITKTSFPDLNKELSFISK